ncbi:MAG: hypothetical protein ABI323_07990 [Solirubrobacteraceae bacterium]
MAEVLGRPVVIAIPALGGPVISPAAALRPEQLQAVSTFATEAVRGVPTDAPAALAEAVSVRIGEQVVGIVAAGTGPEARMSAADQRAWLEAAAAAASVTALIRGAHEAAPEDAQAALVWELLAGPTEDLPGFLARARRLGVELGAGAAAICAQRGPDRNGIVAVELAREHAGLLAETPGARLFGLAPSGARDEAGEMAASLRKHGMTVTISAVRRDPALLHEALREAELLIELTNPRRSAGWARRDLSPADRRTAARSRRAWAAPRQHHLPAGRLRPPPRHRSPGHPPGLPGPRRIDHRDR